ncbi:hypothetical protein JX265_009627 [Neoarthrinium moseri]|uniref:Uncharacterized protein n=1 Tax=Neoarthrinium moseri TaxID=1658444 RepID=A0A9P9WF87_9PEZI|nr:uncharacterized protein JN550_010862 [Neoarthrinium moseri]KAI1844110.1 hypothetical protein JX266_009783 [Neoarthrinium moseri]KAI1861008.1 hypothetical protein JX265_009627 [Neoarthrinium moseri]KAI1861332.1 hypothetical protein JN550_010862 [Neoarthrinium moseri]
MAQRGFLVPEWYHTDPPTDEDMNIASIIWGFSLSCACFTFVKGARQSWISYRRTKNVNAYVVMIWLEWLACLVISVISWLFLRGVIPISFWFAFFLLCLWVIQIQCIMQIIINRIALLMVRQEKARKIRWTVFAIISAINISVFCIWIPARLQISETYVNVNNVWDRCEKAIIAIVDMGLNFYFIHLVRAKLIANGLTKYTRLFHFNLGMIAISLALDIILIGVMSLPNSVIYVQFHPLIYLVKLHIEMNIADLIARVVKASNPHQTGSYGNSHSNRHEGSHKMTTMVRTGHNTGTQSRIDEETEDSYHHNRFPKGGIQRTIETQVIREDKDDDAQSESSSTRELQKHFAIV